MSSSSVSEQIVYNMGSHVIPSDIFLKAADNYKSQNYSLLNDLLPSSSYYPLMSEKPF